MEVDDCLHQASLSLYHFMCQHIVGTEETVRKKRLMNTILDNVNSSGDSLVEITSGSTGEGLDIKESDLDTMVVYKTIIVHEDIGIVKPDPRKINLVMEMNDTKPGFTLLRFVELPDVSIMKMCSFNGKSWYLSSDLWKYQNMGNFNERNFHDMDNIHGPCFSDKNETLDVAFCLHNAKWIRLAEEWITRPNMSWPSTDVKSNIIEHGVLYVPIGCKGSANEALEWRISFSVAEKLLIYTFSHTQLLCYALMKILLKDVINHGSDCKNLLCSYFIKIIILWVSEELTGTQWKPENLIKCFLICLKRLLYYVEYSMCPHYFIPIINMFESKIEGQSQKVLLRYLNALFDFGWRCVLFSKQFHNFTILTSEVLLTSEIKNTQLELFLTTKYACQQLLPLSRHEWIVYRKLIRLLNVTKSSFIKLNYSRYISGISARLIEHSTFYFPDINKNVYSQNRTQLSYLLQNVNHDAVSGWLMLAAFFYKIRQYKEVLCILSYVLSKCTPEKLYSVGHLTQIQLNLIRSTTLQSLGIMRALKLIVMHDACFFMQESRLIPEEMALDCSQTHGFFSPVVFAHFLRFLCHYHLNQTRNCYESIRDLSLTIGENYYIANATEKGMGFNLLGIALQLIGQNKIAEKAFRKATKYNKVFNTAAEKRILMMYSNC